MSLLVMGHLIRPHQPIVMQMSCKLALRQPNSLLSIRKTAQKRLSGGGAGMTRKKKGSALVVLAFWGKGSKSTDDNNNYPPPNQEVRN